MIVETHEDLTAAELAGCRVPVDGPPGELLHAQGRHNMRPAHPHVLVWNTGYKTIASQV